MDHGAPATGSDGIPVVHPDSTPHKRQNSRKGPHVPDLEALANAMSPEPATPPGMTPTTATMSTVTPPQPWTRAGPRGRSGPAPSRAAGSLPDEPLSPGPNCHPDEIKDWASRVLERMERQIGNIAAQQRPQSLQIHKAASVTTDLSKSTKKAFDTLNQKFEDIYYEFQTIKAHGQGQPELKQGVTTALGMAQKSNRDTAMDLRTLRAEVGEYARRVDANAEYIKKVEDNFKMQRNAAISARPSPRVALQHRPPG